MLYNSGPNALQMAAFGERAIGRSLGIEVGVEVESLESLYPSHVSSEYELIHFGCLITGFGSQETGVTGASPHGFALFRDRLIIECVYSRVRWKVGIC